MSLPGQEMLVPKHERAMGHLRGSVVAGLLWMLLLWSGDRGCQAQRAGRAVGGIQSSGCVFMCVWVWAGGELVPGGVRVWVIPGVVSTVPQPV